jgi:hypothetical protein
LHGNDVVVRATSELIASVNLSLHARWHLGQRDFAELFDGGFEVVDNLVGKNFWVGSVWPVCS